MEFWYLRETGFSGPKTLASLGQTVVSTVLNAADQQKIVSVSEVASGSQTFLKVIIEQPEPWQSAETFDIETHQPFVELLNGTDILQMRMERERRQLAGKNRVIRLWLNSAHGYAVEEKWESRKETGETMFHTKNSDFVQVTPDGVWMPKRCVVESHAYSEAVRRQHYSSTAVTADDRRKASCAQLIADSAQIVLNSDAQIGLNELFEEVKKKPESHKLLEKLFNSLIQAWMWKTQSTP